MKVSLIFDGRSLIFHSPRSGVRTASNAVVCRDGHTTWIGGRGHVYSTRVRRSARVGAHWLPYRELLLDAATLGLLDPTATAKLVATQEAHAKATENRRKAKMVLCYLREMELERLLPAQLSGRLTKLIEYDGGEA